MAAQPESHTLRLEPVTEKHLGEFAGTLSYGAMSPVELRQMLAESQAKRHGEAYYELWAVCTGEEVVGFVSLYSLSQETVSIGIEVKPAFQRRGYAFRAEQSAIRRAAETGYRYASATVREDNAASIALHEKLGFVLAERRMSRNGAPVRVYRKPLFPGTAVSAAGEGCPSCEIR